MNEEPSAVLTHSVCTSRIPSRPQTNTSTKYPMLHLSVEDMAAAMEQPEKHTNDKQRERPHSARVDLDAQNTPGHASKAMKDVGSGGAHRVKQTYDLCTSTGGKERPYSASLVATRARSSYHGGGLYVNVGESGVANTPGWIQTLSSRNAVHGENLVCVCA
jgi:hypothetical protein